AQAQRTAESERDAAVEKAAALQRSVGSYQNALHAAERDRDALTGMVETLQKSAQSLKQDQASIHLRAEQAETEKASLQAQVKDLTEQLEARPLPDAKTARKGAAELATAAMFLAAGVAAWPGWIERPMSTLDVQLLAILGNSAVPLAVALL